MNFASFAAVLLALAVALGAFGAHGLKNHLDAYLMSVWEKAVFYHFVHALGLLIVEALRRAGVIANTNLTSWLLVAGIVLFSGSLYTLALTRITVLGAITPLGGMSFIVAWLWLAVNLARTRA